MNEQEHEDAYYRSVDKDMIEEVYKQIDAEDTTDVHDVIQITDPKHHWFPCLLIVTEVRSWGVVALCLIPNNGRKPTGTAYVRLLFGVFEVVGPAILTPGEGDESS